MKPDIEDFLNNYLSCKIFVNNLSLKDFRFHGKIGEGAFSKVYKARLISPEDDSDLPDVLAIKIMSKKTISKLGLTSKVIDEAKLLSCLPHFSIIKYYASFETVESFNIVLECLSTNLFVILQRQVYFGESAARYFSSQILLGLEYLHSFHIAYRDLKPDNTLITADGVVKLSDLSFAKYIPGRSYTCQGTLEYMAPEIILNKGHGLAVDMWAFGVLLYELCAGYTPFKSKYQLKLVRNIASGKIQFPPNFSDELRDLIKSLLVIDVTKRLGCMKGKEEKLKNHPWYGEEVEWHRDSSCGTILPKELNDLDIFNDIESDMSDISLEMN